MRVNLPFLSSAVDSEIKFFFLFTSFKLHIELSISRFNTLEASSDFKNLSIDLGEDYFSVQCDKLLEEL